MNVWRVYISWRGHYAWDTVTTSYWLRQFDYDSIRNVLYALSRISGGTMLAASLFRNPLHRDSEELDVSDYYRRASVGAVSCIGWALFDRREGRVFIPYADASLPVSPTDALPYVWTRYAQLLENSLATLRDGVYEPLQISRIVIKVRQPGMYIRKMRKSLS